MDKNYISQITLATILFLLLICDPTIANFIETNDLGFFPGIIGVTGVVILTRKSS